MNIIAISNDLYDKTDLYGKKNVLYVKKRELLTYEYLNNINPEYVFFPHWSYIIPEKIYNNFNCIIFHMTDLPFGRGGSPLQNLISRGIYQTKISAIKCCEVIDGGDIYLKKDFDISEGSAEEIYQRAGYIISKMIDEIIEKGNTGSEEVQKTLAVLREKLEILDKLGDEEILSMEDLDKILQEMEMAEKESDNKNLNENKDA